MKKSRFTETQIVFTLKQQQAGIDTKQWGGKFSLGLMGASLDIHHTTSDGRLVGCEYTMNFPALLLPVFGPGANP